VNLADELENCRAAAIDDAKDVFEVEARLCAFYDALTPERQREADAIIVSWLTFREAATPANRTSTLSRIPLMVQTRAIRRGIRCGGLVERCT